MDFENALLFAREFLNTKLDPGLFYHNYDHTMEVLDAAGVLARMEGIENEEDIILLKTAALFHDCGFAVAYHDNEEEGCRIARKQLPSNGYSEEQIESICRLIMATKSPQQPRSHLEKILCDADLFYLGTSRFESTGKKLFEEWKLRGKITNEEEWNDLQIRFLQQHCYWTQSAREHLEPVKQKNLQQLLSTTT